MAPTRAIPEPVDAGTLHADLGDVVSLHDFEHLLKIRCQNAALFLKNDTVLIENTHKDAIFVDVKTAYLSHRQNFFGDTMPVITLDLCGAPGGDDRLPTKIRQRS